MSYLISWTFGLSHYRCTRHYILYKIYVKKLDFIAGDDQVCSPHVNVLPLAGTNI